MKPSFNQTKAILLALSLGLNCPAYASIPRPVCSSNDANFIKTDGTDKQIDLTYLANLSELAKADLVTTEQIIPTNMQATGSEFTVGRQILQHSLATFIEKSDTGKSLVGNRLKSIEQPMNKELSISENHKIKFEVKAAQALAALKYSGVVDAALKFQVGPQSLDFEMSKPLAANTRMVFNHTQLNSEVKNIIGFRMQF